MLKLFVNCCSAFLLSATIIPTAAVIPTAAIPAGLAKPDRILAKLFTVAFADVVLFAATPTA